MHFPRAFFPGRDEFSDLVRLAGPVVVVQVGIMLMGVVDTIMVGHLSPLALAAVALGNLYFTAFAMFGMGILTALDPLISQALGAGDESAAARAVQRAMAIAAVLTGVVSVLMLPSAPVFRLLRQPESVIPIASAYVLVTIPGLLPFFAFIVFRQTLQAMRRVTPIVVAVVVGNVVNLLLNWVLIYGRLGAPALGAVGSGWASTLARWFMAAMLLRIAWPWVGRWAHPIRGEALRWAPLRAMLGLGFPIGAQFALEWGAFGAVGILMGWLGPIPMAGHQVALNLASLTFMVPLGVAQATAVLVGRSVGREDAAAARRAAGAGLGAGAMFMALTAIVFTLVPGPLAETFSSDREVLALAVTLIPIAGVFQIFDGLQVVSIGVLRGVGDTRAPMVANVLGFWMLGMPISLLLAFRLGRGPVGLWWGLVVGLAAVAFFLLARIRRRFGGELKRLVLAGH